jgi:hypothetical protein
MLRWFDEMPSGAVDDSWIFLPSLTPGPFCPLRRDLESYVYNSATLVYWIIISLVSDSILFLLLIFTGCPNQDRKEVRPDYRGKVLHASHVGLSHQQAYRR